MRLGWRQELLAPALPVGLGLLLLCSMRRINLRHKIAMGYIHNILCLDLDIAEGQNTGGESKAKKNTRECPKERKLTPKKLEASS